MPIIRYYKRAEDQSLIRFNYWDAVALLIIFSIIGFLAYAAQSMSTPYSLGEDITIHTDPSYLPFYAARTVLRLFIALLFSLLFTFVVGTWAAKSYRAERLIIPMLDILQSIPVLSFLSITITGFISLFPGSLLGPECASIFAIFTAQVWNMVLGFYQSIRSVPPTLKDTTTIFHLSTWQRFWRLEVPFSTSSLLWNTMISMSSSWFFVVASEAITVANHDIRLPGIGSYIYAAITEANQAAVGYAILTMFIVILIYDQLLFRPLLYWVDKFSADPGQQGKISRSWFLRLLQKTHFLTIGSHFFSIITDKLRQPLLARRRRRYYKDQKPHTVEWIFTFAWNVGLPVISAVSIYYLIQFIISAISFSEVLHVLLLGFVTALRVFILIILCSLLWVPVGVWIGRRPRIAAISQPIIQFVAAFPAYLLFPIITITIVNYDLNPEIWTSPLMILGSQWYILINVIAGVTQIPKELYQVTRNFRVSGWQWWRTLALPGIFPFYITGAMTAAGGAWNAAIVAEWVSWGNTNIQATGLGQYIKQYTLTGDFQRIALGTGIMCLYVLLFNRIVWRPLYKLAQTRYYIE